MFTYKRSDRELLVYLIGNASTNGGDASRVGAFFSSLVSRRENMQLLLAVVALVFNSYLYPDARRVAPISARVFSQRLLLRN